MLATWIVVAAAVVERVDLGGKGSFAEMKRRRFPVAVALVLYSNYSWEGVYSAKYIGSFIEMD